MSHPEDEPALAVESELCEYCDAPMPPGAIGYHPKCKTDAEVGTEDFWEWGGWRRAFAAVEHGERDPGPGTVCGG